ncbi:Gfo/Idh/MocA family oxidoreductase [Zavarzinia sp. CC-PAN008]|uniref:Gfo/Idh/MocA family oxidoreductase n=1 Tax=Zavarzinia sp. CC-PAN008 TaxID=3243332 RepID=UPI003F7470EE
MPLLPRPPIRVAVVGCGVMGHNHLRIYDLLRRCELVAVVDSDPRKAELAAQRYGCRVVPHVEDLVGLVDAASVVVPSALHAPIGTFLLQNGIHCLIEKPLAPRAEECLPLVEAAEARGLVLAVGHTERFNPAVQKLAEILADVDEVHAIEARRLSGPTAGRIVDIDVVGDLMVHDLDIVLSLIEDPVVSVQAQGVFRTGQPGPDYASALLGFGNGSIASFSASRITQNKVRDLHLSTSEGFITVDYIDQRLIIHRQGDIQDPAAQLPSGNYVLDIAMERVLVRKAEPLTEQIVDFLDAVTRNRAPQVTGRMALASMTLVRRIQDQIAATSPGLRGLPPARAEPSAIAPSRAGRRPA